MSINLINYALAKKDWKKAYEDLKVLEIGGRNLIPNTSNEYRTVRHSQWYAQIALLDLNEIGVRSGDTITFSIYVRTGSNGGARARLRWESGSTNESVSNSYGTKMPANSEGKIHVTAIVPQDVDRVRLVLNNVDNSNPYDSEYKEEKLEKGNKATDWTPAPEDINAHPFVAELAETVFRSKQNEERIRNLENALTALGGGA